MSSEKTLLANARQSVKDELAARRKQQRELVRAFWDDCYDLLSDYARDCIQDSYESDGKVFDCTAALQNVRKNLHRCKAQTKPGFLSWAVKQLAKEKGFHLAAGAIQRFDLDISDWIDDAALRLSRYANFPEHVKDGPRYRVKMGESGGVPIVWTIPEQHWEFVRKLWPVTLKQWANGSYFIAKQIAGQTIPVHRLILNCEPGDTVQSASGNFLDWTSLYVRPLNQSGIYEGRNTSWNQEAQRPNTAQEEFEGRFKPTKALEGYGTNFDCTERFLLPRRVPVNMDLANKTTAFGKVVSTGWGPSTAKERYHSYAPELPSIPVEQSARRLAAEQALDSLGL
jgi:hypothetical protein